MKSFFNKNKSESNLGFGTAISGKSQKRLINRDGTFNVKRKGLNYFSSLSLYHSLLEMSWLNFFGLTALGYFFLNLFFAIIYLLIGDNSISGLPAETFSQHLLNAFFFSVQTSSTIGYGHLIPGNLYANLVVSVESFLSILGVAVITGLLFARFSKPNAKILFSDYAIIAPYKEIKAFEFRIVNARKNQLLEMQAEVSLVMFVNENNKRVRKFFKLDLETSKLDFFPLSWTIVHPINKESPLFKINEMELKEADPEFFILLKGVDDTFNQYVYSRSSYKISELIFDAKFKSIINIYDSKNEPVVDISRLSEIENVNLQ